MSINNQGQIVCVGVGMTMASHLSPLSKSYIEKADIVFTGMSNRLVEQWVESMNSNTVSLQSFYAEGKDRRDSYREMVDIMMKAVRAGQKVVGAFYGHPGVFAWAPHKVIETARQEGYEAHMEAGISAEDCLYADLNIDPGKVGAQHYEASQFMFYQKPFTNTAYLVLWQIGLAGDRKLTQFNTHPASRQVLVNKLLKWYPPSHQVILYECPTLPVHKFKAVHVALENLANCEVSQHTTLVVPPSELAKEDRETLDELAKISKSLD